MKDICSMSETYKECIFIIYIYVFPSVIMISLFLILSNQQTNVSSIASLHNQCWCIQGACIVRGIYDFQSSPICKHYHKGILSNMPTLFHSDPQAGELC